MNINYDSVADVIYFKVKDMRPAKSMRVNDCLIVDFSSAGDIVGMELLNASSEQGVELQKNIKDGVPVNIISATPIAT